MSDAVERRVYELLNRPTRSPYGNPIPGLEALDVAVKEPAINGPSERNLAFPGLSGSVRRAPHLRVGPDRLRCAQAVPRRRHRPGTTVTVAQERDGVRIDQGSDQIRLPREVASRVFVTGQEDVVPNNVG